MTTQDAAAETPTLAFRATLGAAFGIVFGRFGLFLRAAAVPLLLSLGVAAIEISIPAIATAIGGLPIREMTEALLYILVSSLWLLPYSILGVVLTRLYLDRPGVGTLPHAFSNRRFWRYFAYSLLMTLAFLLALGLVIGLISFLAESDFGEMRVGGIWILLAFALYILVIIHFLLRLSLAFPAIAMDHPLRFAGSWRLTRWCSFKFSAAVGLVLLMQLLAIFIGAALFAPPDEGIAVSEIVPAEEDIQLAALLLASVPQALWNVITGLLFFAMTTGALASSFAQLSGWSAPRQEILERFE